MSPIHYVLTTILSCVAFAIGMHAEGYIRDLAFFYSGCTATIVGMFLYAEWKYSE